VFEFVINPETAKTLGIDMPPTLLGDRSRDRMMSACGTKPT
jgi:hypothetical protein